MENDTLTKTIILKANREQVWSFLTDKDKLGQWFYRAREDLSDGADFELIGLQDDGSERKNCWGSVQHWQPPSKLVWAFTIKPLDGALTKVTWTLEEVHEGTRLTMVHEGISAAAGEAGFSMLCGLDAGWDRYFGKLREAIGEG